ncbi:hypothetical protein PS2_0163 [Aeromonas phage PS2]|uniref:Uncharacterized protein n=1 Tax=Aeromonas phage PS1 TaxID=2591406 RepID=A0A514TUL4_9CAUD|nr:hypothetical protein PQC64_gp104 [Aeromonas phage PS1]QDJ96670.1 hypothetical protein PS1_0159 [Aeromonas phage PS1]QFR59304.1 hypothetical protein PS2_0163 [Aeromonas phage PS2]
MDNNFPYNHRINYNTFVTGVWIPYNGWRVKSLHDVKLRDGTIVTQLRPNGAAWYGSKFDIKDDDVIAIRVVPDEERGKYEYTGDFRIERDIHYFGHVIPVWLEDEQRFIYPDEVPEGKFITPLQQALWKKCCTKEGDKEESWEVIVLTVTGRLSDNKLLSFTNDELVLLFDHSDSRLTTPEVLSERIRNKALTGFNSF